MSFDIWRNRETIANQAYNLDNYKMIQKKADGVCVIYCSSNDIWYPNEKDIFERFLKRIALNGKIFDIKMQLKRYLSEIYINRGMLLGLIQE